MSETKAGGAGTQPPQTDPSEHLKTVREIDRKQAMHQKQK